MGKPVKLMNQVIQIIMSNPQIDSWNQLGLITFKKTIIYINI